MCAVLLLLSFGWHAVDLDHHHPQELFGEGVLAALHSNFVRITLFAVTTFLILLNLLVGVRIQGEHYLRNAAVISKLANIFLRSCADGVLATRRFG